MSLLEELNQVLEIYDARLEPISESSIADRLRLIRNEDDKNREDEPVELLAESLAFGFVENYETKQGGWGTYYGPMAILQNDDGQWIESPSIKLVTEQIIDYWKIRAEQAIHPVLKARYSDLIWDLSERITGKKAGVEFPKAVIEQNIQIANKALTKHDIAAIPKLIRALNLALSINDVKLVPAVVDAMIKYEDDIGVDSKPGLWGFCFDNLVKNRKVTLSTKQRDKIISDLESRLDRIANPSKGDPGDPFAAESAGIRLAKYYQGKEDTENAKRVVKVFTDAFIEASKNAAGMVASSWLEKVHSTLVSFGMGSEADKVSILIREAGEKSREEMQSISHSVEIPKGELEEYLNQITEGELGDSLDRIAAQFIPKKTEIEKQVKDLAEKAPLQNLVTMSIQDDSGRTVATVGPTHEDMEGRVIHQMSQNMQFEGQFLFWVLNRAVEKFSLDGESFYEHISQSPMFSEDRKELILRGLAAHFSKDYSVSLCVLIPQIEACLRLLLHHLGGSIYKSSRSGGLMERTLEEILRDEKVLELIGEDIATYFRTLLTDPRGWNLRNQVCHGLMSSNGFGMGVSNRIMHVLLVLALFRPAPVDQSGFGDGESPSNE